MRTTTSRNTYQRKKDSLEKGEIKQNKIKKVRNQIKDGKNYANSSIHGTTIYQHTWISHKLYIVSSIYINGESFTFCHGAMYFQWYRLVLLLTSSTGTSSGQHQNHPYIMYQSESLLQRTTSSFSPSPFVLRNLCSVRRAAGSVFRERAT